MPLFLPDTMDAEAWCELAAYDPTRWICFRQIQGWAANTVLTEDAERPGIVRWEMVLIDAEGVGHPFKGEFAGRVPPPSPPPVYKTRFRRRAVI